MLCDCCSFEGICKFKETMMTKIKEVEELDNVTEVTVRCRYFCPPISCSPILPQYTNSHEKQSL